MKKGKVGTTIVVLLAALLLSQTVLAAEQKSSSAGKPRYKKVSGEVVSIDQNSIVIRTSAKGPLTLAVTKNTDLSGRQIKAGDRATVNYRVDKNGKTATRVQLLAAAGKPAQAPVRPAAK